MPWGDAVDGSHAQVDLDQRVDIARKSFSIRTVYLYNVDAVDN